MKSIFRALFFTVVTGFGLISSVPSTEAQGLSSSGTDYWLGFMPNGQPGGGAYQRLNLFIASGTANKVTITLQGSSRRVSMAAGDIYDMLLDQNAITTQTETPTDNAVHVTSQNPVTI